MQHSDLLRMRTMPIKKPLKAQTSNKPAQKAKPLSKPASKAAAKPVAKAAAKPVKAVPAKAAAAKRPAKAQPAKAAPAKPVAKSAKSGSKGVAAGTKFAAKGAVAPATKLGAKGAAVAPPAKPGAKGAAVAPAAKPGAKGAAAVVAAKGAVAVAAKPAPGPAFGMRAPAGKPAKGLKERAKLPPLYVSKPVIGSVMPPVKAPPRKKVSPLATADVDRLRTALIITKARLTGTVSGMRSEALEKDDALSHDSIADHGTDVFDQDITLSLVENEQVMIQSIDESLMKISEGTYGKCENCTDNIRKERLEALPFARLCLQCQEAQESGRA